MIIKNIFLKFSSLCIMGCVTLIVNECMPTQVVDASLGISGDENSIDVIEKNKQNVSTGIMIAGIDGELMSDSNSKEALKQKNEKIRDVKFLSSLPSIKGLKSTGVNLVDFKGIAIVKDASFVNIRKSANKKATIVGTLTKNGGCFVLEEVDSFGEKWCKIKSGNIRGYIISSALVKGDAALDMIPKVGKYVINVSGKNNLNVRSKPSTKSKIITTISKGEALEVKSVIKDWVEVATYIDEKNGYVQKNNVKITYQIKTASRAEDDYATIGFAGARSSVVKNCKRYLGKPYISGGNNLDVGTDCSGYVRGVFKKYAGIQLPRIAHDQSKRGRSVSEAELKPGDLVFYTNGGTHVTHVAIYIGVMGGRKTIIHSSTPGDCVKYSNMDYSSNRFYKRILD